MRQFVSLIILFLYVGCYSYSKEYTLMEVNLYPQKNYSIMFLCIKEEDDCIPIYKTDDMYEIIGCFEENTLPFADYFQLDGFYMTAMQEAPASADKFIKGQDLSYDMVYKSKTVKLILSDKTIVEISVATINADLYNDSSMGSTSIGLEPDYFLIPYNIKYVKEYENSLDSLSCIK